MQSVVEAAEYPQQDVVINALMGVAGLLPTVRAIQAGNDVALANKETLVAGGKLVMQLAKEKGVRLTPIDSEHSAIFQCLQGNLAQAVERLIITASGGPFYGRTREKLKGIKKGASPPKLEHGSQNHHRLLYPDEQGTGIYRSDVAVFHAARAH